MFELVTLEKNVVLHPRHMGPHLRSHLDATVASEYEGSCTSLGALILHIEKVEPRGRGRVQDGTGMICFAVLMRALVFSAAKGEVVEGTVADEINPLGFFCNCGPLQVFVSKSAMPSDYTFVSTGDTPRWEPMTPDPSSATSLALSGLPSAPNLTSSGNKGIIVPDCIVRVRLIGTSNDMTKLFAIGTINEMYLGRIDDRDERDL